MLPSQIHCIHHLHISHNAPYLPLKILHKPCFSFFLGITAVPREIETMLMRNFVGQIRCVMGDVEVANAQHTEYTMKSF